VQFHCPSRIQIPAGDYFHYAHILQKYSASQTEFSPSYEDIRPDLLVTVNFTMLNISSASILDGAINSVQIMLGLTNATVNVLQTTSPTTLLPGMNVLGMTRLTFRQKFGKATVAALGVEVSTFFSPEKG
jgi:hypothetical protein